MIKIVLILSVFCISLNFFTSTNAKMYRVGQTFQNEIEFSKRFTLPLSPGKWEIVNKYNEHYFFNWKGYGIARIENNEIMELIGIHRAGLTGLAMGWVDHAVGEITFKDKYDGCYERPEYYLVEVFKKGGTHNCLIIAHNDTNKEIYAPDDPNTSNAILKKYIKDNSIIVPPITFWSFHSYYSRLNRSDWYRIGYWVNPKLVNSPETKFHSEESSEFHRANIFQYPEHKLAMDRFISMASKRHKLFEKAFRAKEHHLLNLDTYILENDIEDSKAIGEKKTFIEDLEKLNELYKTGVITKEEFEKAKKKILN
tara:strand:+ start:307 stop:1239 length:933 start_codon:yes stop_codon:yes gene_type:complete